MKKCKEEMMEIPSGGGPQATKKERAVMDMGYHYDGQKLLRSAQIKCAILQLRSWPCLRQACCEPRHGRGQG